MGGKRMGVYGVAKLMLGLMGIGIICIIIAIVLGIRQYRNKGIPLEKRLGIVFLMIGVVLLFGPFAWIMEQREDAIFTEELHYVPTDTVLKWEKNGVSFYYNDQKYEDVELQYIGSKDYISSDASPFDWAPYINLDNERNRKAAFNIWEKDDFISKMIKRTGRITMYEFKSPFASHMYYTNQDEIYCLADEKSKIVDYYSKLTNYDWYIRKYGEEKEAKMRTTFSDDEKKLIETLGVHGQKKTLDKKKIDSENEDIYYEIDVISKDKLLWGSMNIIRYKGEWYWDMDEAVEDELDEESNLTYAKKLAISISKKINRIYQDLNL